MTQAEFEKEARRVLAALDVEADAPVEMHHREDTHYSDGPPRKDGPMNTFQMVFRGEGFSIVVKRIILATGTTFWFSIGNTGAKWSWAFRVEPKLDIRAHSQSPTPAKYVSQGMRAVFRLGYDMDSIANKAGIVVTAHEQLQWYLEDKDKFALNSEGAIS